MRGTQADQWHRLLLEPSKRDVWDKLVTENETNHSLSNSGIERYAKKERKE